MATKYYPKERKKKPYLTTTHLAFVGAIIVLSMAITEWNISHYKDDYKEGYTDGYEYLASMAEGDVIQNAIDETSCEGIEGYYTSNGFFADLKVMDQEYRSCYYYEPEPDFSIQNPQAIRDCNGVIDCEDMAHGVICLAEIYGINCNYYLSQTYSDRIGRYTLHMGAECLINEQWVKVS